VVVRVFEYTGHDPSSPVGETKTEAQTDVVNGAYSFTLDSAPASTSEVLATLAWKRAFTSSASIAVGTGWTELYDVSLADGDQCTQTQVRSGSTSTTIAWDDVNTASGDLTYTIALAFEVKAAATGAVEQEGFRWGDDDDAEADHTWAADQDANITAPLDENVLLRVLLNGTDDPASAAYTLRYQKNGSGGYVAVPVGSGNTVAPTVEAGDCTESGNNTATTSWDVSYPAYVSGDLLVFHVASDADVTHDWPATGPNGETVNTIADSTGGTAQRASGFWFVGSATTGAGTLTVTPSATEQWTAAVLKVLAGEFNATTPIQTNVGTANDTTADTSWDTPAWTSDATANGRVICFAAHDTVTTSATPAGWTTLVARDRGACGLTLAARDAANTASESIASASFTKTSETDSSFGYVINGAVTTNEIYVATSANIAAGGEATTARLTAPSGKTTSDFVTGRRWDDENGTDSIDITADDYTEVEWCLRAQSPAETDDYYEFRVYAGSTALDTYTVTPKWTIGSGAASAALTGSSVTASAGTAGVAHEQAVTGSEVTASAGTLSPLAEYSAALTGAEVTASAGTLAPVQTAALTGSAATVSAGSVASTRTVAISGSEVETAAGTLTPGSETIAELTGAEVTASAGSLAVERSADLAGSESTTAAGVLTAGSTRALAGAETTAAAGTIVAGPSAALVGSEVESASGTLSSGATVALVGSEVESATGTLAPVTDDSVSLTGSAATASAGTVAPDVSVELTGDEVATAAGTLGVSIGENVSVELTGAAATCSAGSLGAGAAIGLSGAAATTAAGTVGGYVDLGLTGIEVAGLAGIVTAVGADVVIPDTERTIQVRSQTSRIPVHPQTRRIPVRSQTRRIPV